MKQLINDDWLHIAFVVECRDELVYTRVHNRWNSITATNGYTLLLW